MNNSASEICADPSLSVTPKAGLLNRALYLCSHLRLGFSLGQQGLHPLQLI
jgi:hypothetical protein